MLHFHTSHAPHRPPKSLLSRTISFSLQAPSGTSRVFYPDLSWPRSVSASELILAQHRGTGITKDPTWHQSCHNHESHNINVMTFSSELSSPNIEGSIFSVIYHTFADKYYHIFHTTRCTFPPPKYASYRANATQS